MWRLTEYVNGVPAICLKKLRFHFSVNDIIGGAIAERLAKFEDIGLEPEQIVKMIPPCKIGDRVFGIRVFSNNVFRVKEGIVRNMHYGDDMRICISVKDVCTGEWGRNIFATREEAEAALAK